MKKIGNGQESRVLEHYRTEMKKNPRFWSITGRERTRIPGSGALPDGNEEESRVLGHSQNGNKLETGYNLSTPPPRIRAKPETEIVLQVLSAEMLMRTFVCRLSS